jgi:hypothetical protein
MRIVHNPGLDSPRPNNIDGTALFLLPESAYVLKLNHPTYQINLCCVPFHSRPLTQE